jgi:hypothetical protein
MPRHANWSNPHLHQPALRAVIDAAPPVAELAHAIGDRGALLSILVLACGELVHGFASAPDSPARRRAHHRAWAAVRDLDREVLAARLGRRAPAKILARAQRAVDRADVLVGDLPGAALA